MWWVRHRARRGLPSFVSWVIDLDTTVRWTRSTMWTHHVVTEGGGMSHGERDEDWLDLADAIEVLRGQLSEAQRRAQGSELRFVLGEITAEFEVELVRAKNGGGALRFGVVEADARRERSTRSTQRVTLRLNPERRGGGDVAVGDTE